MSWKSIWKEQSSNRAAVLYYVCPLGPEELNAIEETTAESDRPIVENPKVQAVLDEYPDVFRNTLPDGTTTTCGPSKRDSERVTV